VTPNTTYKTNTHAPVFFTRHDSMKNNLLIDNKGFGDFKIGGQIIHTVKYADDLVLLAKEGKVLQKMIEKLIDIGRCYGMEMNVEKTKVMRISREPFPVKIMIDQKQLDNVDFLNILVAF
jgi:hypothetical protein